MYPETIDAQTKRVLEKIKTLKFVKNFYLAGGTALAIQCGHRKSIDLDFFSKENFSTAELKEELLKIVSLAVTSEEDGTLNCIIDGVKVSFLRYRYDLLFPFVEIEGVLLADERDIAAMKIDAASSRGSKKDFIDIYELLKKYSLAEIIDFFEKKYSAIQYNKLHILKSLVFFDDAEEEPMPIMLNNVDWKEVKEKITKEVGELNK